MEFKKKYSLEVRKIEAARIVKEHPNRIPIIVEKLKNSDIDEIDKKKYLVPEDLTVGQFMYVIRKRINVPSSKAIFIFLENGTIPASASLINSVYGKHKSEDYFLYFFYSGENTFG